MVPILKMQLQTSLLTLIPLFFRHPVYFFFITWESPERGIEWWNFSYDLDIFCKEEQRMAKERWRGEEERRRVEEERRRVETERQRMEEERRRQSSLSSFSSSSSSYSSRGSSSRTSSSRGSSTRPLGKQACRVDLQDRERACSCHGVRPSSLS